MTADQFEMLPVNTRDMLEELVLRVRPRFFDQVGHQTTNASIGNKYFFT